MPKPPVFPKMLSVLILSCLLSFPCFAQTEIDGILMSKKMFCAGVVAQRQQWDEYWEGTLKRTNLNLGTVSASSLTLMGNYGITSKINVIAQIPYIKTNASAGQLAGQKGFQDASLSVKWNFAKQKIKKAELKQFLVAGGSLPVSDYTADLMPLSIGQKSKTLMVRWLADYQLKKFTVTGGASYLRRSNVFLDRNTYFTTTQHYTNEVKMPNALYFNFRTGYRSNKLIAELIAENWTTLGGFDISKNNMPFVSNEMNATRVGIYTKYTLPFLKNLSVLGQAMQTVAGRNVGEALSYGGGVFYIVNFNNKPKKA